MSYTEYVTVVCTVLSNMKKSYGHQVYARLRMQSQEIVRYTSCHERLANTRRRIELEEAVR